MRTQGDGLSARRVAMPVARHVVRRGRLLDRLDALADAPVVVVCGPAGAGKSLLVASWMDDRAVQDAVWVNLASVPAGSTEVWAAVVAALAASLPDPTDDLDAVAVLALSRPGEVAARLGGWLTDRGRETVLVLDDLHTVSDSDLHAGLVELVAAAGDHLHLVVVTRHDPPWPLHRMRADGLLRDVRADVLAFDNTETEELFALLGLDIGAAQIADLVTQTQGWAAGLRLAALGAAAAPDPDQYVAAISGRSDYIADYLMREVYEGLDQGWRDFLTRIAVVDDISADLADALGAGPDNAARLDELVRQNAFIHQLGHRPGWYRLHPLLVDFLGSRVTNAHQQQTLHGRAAAWFRDQGEPLTALQHALAAHNWDLVDELVETHLVSWTVRRSPAELQRLLAPVPPEQILTQPGLAIGLAASLAMQGQLVGVDQLLDAARAQISAVTGQRRRRYDFLLELISVGIRRWQGDLQAVLDGYRRMPTDPTTMRDLGLADWDTVRTLLIGNQGVCELWTGDIPAARHHLSEAAGVGGSSSLALSTLNAQSHLAYLSWADGELTAALQLADAAVRAFTELQVPDAVQARSAYLALAGVAADRDDRHGARRWLQIARQTAEEPHTSFATELISARLLAADGKPFDAVAVLRDARHRAQDLPPAPWLIAESLRFEARLLTLAGSTAAADQVQALLHDPTQPRERAKPPEQTLRDRVEHHLDLALRAQITGAPEPALTELEHALRLAAPEQLRLPFLISGNDLGQLISTRTEAGTADVPFVADLMVRMNAPATVGHRHAHVFVPLTQRESNILPYLASTLSVKEIAANLYISTNTVKTHQRSIYGKLGAEGRREAVAHARELGLL